MMLTEFLSAPAKGMYAVESEPPHGNEQRVSRIDALRCWRLVWARTKVKALFSLAANNSEKKILEIIWSHSSRWSSPLNDERHRHFWLAIQKAYNGYWQQTIHFLPKMTRAQLITVNRPELFKNRTQFARLSSASLPNNICRSFNSA